MNNILDTCMSILSTTPDRWINLASDISPDLLDLPPAVGEWSARSCLLHLIDTEVLVFPVRVKSFMAGEDFPAFDPQSGGRKADKSRTVRELAV